MYHKTLYSTAAAVLFVVLACGSAESKKNNASPTKSKESEISDIAWAEIDEIYNLNSDTTDLRKNKEWQRFEGKRIRWSGRVSEIGEDFFGNLTLQIKMNPDTLVSDLLIRLKSDQRSKAENFSTGDPISFSGVLDEWGTIMPLTINQGEILE